MLLLSILSVSGCTLTILFAARVAFRANDNPPAAWALAVFLVSVSAFVLDQIAYQQDWFAIFPHCFAVANPFIAAIFPSLFLYVRGVTHPTSRWRLQSLAHFLPTLAIALLELPTYFLSAAEKIAASRLQAAGGNATTAELTGLLVLDSYGLTYLLLAWRGLRRGRARLRESLEEGRSRSLRGLEAFVVLLIVLSSASAIMDFTPWQFYGSLSAAYTAVLVAFASFWWLTDHRTFLFLPASAPPQAQPLLAPASVSAPTTPSGAEPQPDNAAAIGQSVVAISAPASTCAPALDLEVDSSQVPPEATPNPGKTVPAAPAKILRPEEIQRIKKRLEKLISSDKIYLNAELSLQTLAENAGTTRNKMSAGIREIYGLTFYQLISRERVREAASRLQTKAGSNRTIADVAFSVGFNTLSAFNSAFKSEFGITPSEFRKKIALVKGLDDSSKMRSYKVLAKAD